MKFRKKPVEVEALQFTGSAASATPIIDWILRHGGTASYHEHLMDGDLIAHPDPFLRIDTLEGRMVASEGSWVIRGVQGEFYACKPDIFVATYEPVTPPALDTSVRCPECVQGKHSNCTGKTLDPKTDEMVWCECGCHK
jgi:hypothetical protein